jgi:hypothetical protein
MSAPNDLPPPPGALNAASAGTPAQAAGSGPGIGSILKRMVAHLPVALVAIVFGVSITMVLSRSRKPAFSSETVIYYREGISRVYVGVDGEGDVLKSLPGRLKETLISRANLEKVVKEFNLYPQVVAAEGLVAAVDKLRLKITFKPRSAETFLVSFEGSTPEEAQQVTARLADILIEDMAERKKAQAKTTTDFLEGEKKQADEELAKRETDLARFIALHPEFATEANAEQAGSGVRAEKVKATEDIALMAMERQQQRLRAAVAAKNAPAQGGGAVVAPGAGPAAPLPDAVLANQKAAAEAELAAAQKDLDEKSQKLTDAHPDVKAARTRLAAAQAKLNDVMVALRNAQSAPPPAPAAIALAPRASGEDPYDATPSAADDAARLQREIQRNDREIQARKRGEKPAGSASDAANQIIALETEWKALNRERAKARQQQTNVDDRLLKARAMVASELGGYSAQVMVLDPAFLPTQASSMGKSKFIALGIAVSILVGLALAAAWGVMLDDRVFVAEDLGALAPVLVMVPKGAMEKRGRRRA